MSISEKEVIERRQAYNERMAQVKSGANVALGTSVMRCKLQLHVKNDLPGGNGDDVRKHLRFGAVWEGSTEAQQASENAVFGKMTPSAEFAATVTNSAVLDQLEEGAMYIVTFTKAEQQ